MIHDGEKGFLDTLRENSRDVTSLLVYADWLDDAGEADRCRFLRMQQQVMEMTHGQTDFLSLSQQLLALGLTLPLEWVNIVSRPRLLGTVWTGSSSEGRAYTFRYLDPVKLNYTSPSGTFLNGTWRQIGNCVQMEMNNHYADYQGFIAGDEIRGKGHNITQHHWGFIVHRTTDPVLCDPGKPNTTIYGGHKKTDSNP